MSSIYIYIYLKTIHLLHPCHVISKKRNLKKNIQLFSNIACAMSSTCLIFIYIIHLLNSYMMWHMPHHLHIQKKNIQLFSNVAYATSSIYLKYIYSIIKCLPHTTSPICSIKEYSIIFSNVTYAMSSICLKYTYIFNYHPQIKIKIKNLCLLCNVIIVKL